MKNVLKWRSKNIEVSYKQRRTGTTQKKKHWKKKKHRWNKKDPERNTCKTITRPPQRPACRRGTTEPHTSQRHLAHDPTTLQRHAIQDLLAEDLPQTLHQRASKEQEINKGNKVNTRNKGNKGNKMNKRIKVNKTMCRVRSKTKKGKKRETL